MIRKLRWKFVAVCMGLVALVLSAVFGAAYQPPNAVSGLAGGQRPGRCAQPHH